MPEGTCSVEGCPQPQFCRAWCSTHYERWRRTGDPGPAHIQHRRKGSTCKAPSCPQPVKGRGYCQSHLYRLKKYGDPLFQRPSRDARFWQKVNKTGTCWLWTAACSNGYGRFENSLAHRVAYELTVGPIPSGLTLDHLCFTPSCVRPAHLEAVSFAENRRRVRAPATCPKGHDLDGLTRAGWRFCRECGRQSQRRRRAVMSRGEKILRQAVYDRYSGICGICGQAVPFERFHVDHVTPLALGGEHTMANLRPAHPSCNARKGARV